MKISSLLQTFKGQVPKTEQTLESPVKKDETIQIRGKHSEAIKNLFEKYNRVPDDKSVEMINRFMESAEGTDASKLEAVEMALMKDIPITRDNLESIHAALSFGPDQLEELLDLRVPVAESVQLSEEKLVNIVRHLELPEEVKQQIISGLSKGSDIKTVLAEAIKMLGDIIGGGMESTQVEIHKLEMQSVENLLEQLVSAVKNIKVKENHALTAENPIPNKELIPNKEPVMEEVNPEKDILHETNLTDGQASDIQPFEQMIVEAVNMVLQTLDQDLFTVKQYLVEQTTEATIEAKNTFETFKKEIQSLLEIPDKDSQGAITDKVSKAIDKMERLVMRSTVTLFTDMHMEKDLLVSGAKLQEARSILANGQVNEAVQILKEVKQTIDQMTFNPSVKKVQAFVTAGENEINRLLNPGEAQKNIVVETQVREVLQVLKDSNGVRHARDVVDMLRFMGVNHEVEVAEKVDRKDTFKTMEWSQTNVKEILLKLMKEETDQRTVQKSMMNLTGQQMMNQSEDERKRQFHYFNMPYEDGDDIGNMKVYVNGRKEGSRLDAENTEIYFGMTSKNLGELGIKVSIHTGKLSLKVMTDQREKIQTVFESLFDDVEEIGYDKGTLEWTGFNETDTQPPVGPSKSPDKIKAPYEPEKGFDFKI